MARKTCTVCSIEKDHDEFHRNSRQADGRHYRCKECSRRDHARAKVEGRKRRGSPESRFFEKVRQCEVDGCWEWHGTRNRLGYGQFHTHAGMVQAHRWCYEYLRAEIPGGLFLDHLCRNPSCVNPWHLEPVTPQVNSQRGLNSYALRDTCAQGHDITNPENLYTKPDGSGHYCQVCIRENNARRWQRVSALGK